MPRFFFDVFDGRCAVDEIGVELEDKNEAHREALRRAKILLRVTKAEDNAGPGQSWKIVVKSELGEIVLQVEARPGFMALS